MLRRLSILALTVGLALPALAAERPGSISGYVRSATGAPQMGAVVEILGSALHSFTVFTDAQGFYSATGLLPGKYSLKVSAPSFLPVVREQLGLRSGASLVLNVTLSTLFDAINFPSWQHSTDDDDWKWVLRTASNRPILRALDPSSHQTEGGKSSRDLTGTLSFLAGSPSDGFGGAAESTGFSIEKSVFASDTIALRGSVGYGDDVPGAVVHASYRHVLSNGSQPQVSLSLRSLPSPDPALRDAKLQAIALTTADDLALGDILELHFGSELQSIQFMGQANGFRPFGTADIHFSPDTVVEYAYATSEPEDHMVRGIDSSPADFSDSGPRLSIVGFAPSLERSHHHEISISHRSGRNNLQFAVYSDRVADPALTGAGYASSAGGNLLPDVYSGTFTYQGKNLSTRGVRLVAQRKLTSNVTATFDYGYGGVLDLAPGDREATLADVRTRALTRDRHSVAAKVSGTVLSTKTRWLASYKWINGRALTSVDMFNDSAGQTDPYLCVYIRQPIPGTGFLPGHMDAVVDLRNLLAEGYVPVLGEDNHTVYLVQSARAVRGGVAFTF
ncbi:MAG: carboxypeptidase regulatory-like domain-containing protein [Acidobacteriales bacterium]|nr:carboxypeptidase regulatory-like domain-containing protein [Terriglobales bacterium]